MQSDLLFLESCLALGAALTPKGVCRLIRTSWSAPGRSVKSTWSASSFLVVWDSSWGLPPLQGPPWSCRGPRTNPKRLAISLLSKQMPIGLVADLMILSPSLPAAHERGWLVVPITAMSKSGPVGFGRNVAVRTRRTWRPLNWLNLLHLWAVGLRGLRLFHHVIKTRTQNSASICQFITRHCALESHFRRRVVNTVLPALTNHELTVLEGGVARGWSYTRHGGGLLLFSDD
mmetsp:Transcript_5171/g.11399  ORF Transcript_5171/g.11399 Transcript_5171/m.11399 type:complete len:231 (+) Transcript_5171:171-863(+)